MQLPLRDEPLPGFVDAWSVVARASVGLRPPAPTTVSEWAAEHRQLRNREAYSGPWLNEKAPYGVEVMDRCLSRAVNTVVLTGPSQFAKTELGLNVIGHAVTDRPRDILVIQYSRDMAIEFFEDRLNKKLIQVTPPIRARLGPRRTDDKGLAKYFTTGMRVVAGWPVAGQLSARPVALVWLDERDRMPNDIGDEGDPVELALARTRTFKRNGCVLVTSTPSGLDPETAGDDDEEASSILVLFYEGDQNLWNVPCPECGEFWTPGFDAARRPTLAHLVIPEDATPDQARKEAALACPSCGAVLDETAKTWMNARGLWLPKGMTIAAGGEITGARPATRTASYWFTGLMSPFMTIGSIAEDLVKAEEHYRKTQDESKLKTAYNTGLGIPYRSRSSGAVPLEVRELQERAQKETYELGTVAEGVRFLTASVDVGVHKFDCLVKGWDEHAESWLVDRFTLTELSDGAGLDPANVAEHWDLLSKAVVHRRYPLAGDPERALGIACVAIDTGGAAGADDMGGPSEGVSLQAKEYARRLFAAGVEPWRIMPIKGAASRSAPMLPRSPTWETDDAGKRLKNAVAIYVIGVHSLKNVVDTRLRLEKPGPGYVHSPPDAPGRHFKELIGERKKKGKWTRVGPNESFDLEGYCEVARQRLRPERVDWDHPPEWAVSASVAEAPAPEAATPKRRGRRVLSKGIR